MFFTVTFFFYPDTKTLNLQCWVLVLANSANSTFPTYSSQKKKEKDLNDFLEH